MPLQLFLRRRQEGIQRIQIRADQQRPVEQKRVPPDPGGAAGDLPAPDAQIVSPIIHDLRHKWQESLQHRPQGPLIGGQTGPVRGDEREIQISLVVVNGPAAGGAEHHRDPQPPGQREIDFLLRHLVFSQHHAGDVLPEIQHALPIERIKELFLPGQVFRRIPSGAFQDPHSSSRAARRRISEWEGWKKAVSASVRTETPDRIRAESREDSSAPPGSSSSAPQRTPSSRA